MRRMAVRNDTTRDQLEKLLDVLRRSLRYLWLAVVIAIVGTALSVVFALMRPHEYESEAVLLYREMISQSMVQNKEIHVASSAMSSRFRELLLSRQNLARVIEEFALYPDIVEDDGVVAAADHMRTKVGFRDKGSGTFRIAFRGATPAEAQKVTARLTEVLREQDTELRREQARMTLQFLTQEKERASIELFDRQRKQAEFLAEHPEFATDEKGGGGAAIRSASSKVTGGDAMLSALQRQADRIRARLRNPDKPAAPVAPVAPTQRSPARIQAEAQVQQAQREVDNARTDLEDKARRFTDKHPDVTAARLRLLAAEKSQREATAALAAVQDDGKAASVLAAPFDRDALQSELARTEREIEAYKARTAGTAATTKSNLADRLVSLETEWASLDRSVEEARDRVEALEARSFTAEITASSEFAESAQLSVVDEPFVPHAPAGKPRRTVVMAGAALFVALGMALALGLALIDDRVYRRRDLEDLAIAPVLAVVPRGGRRRRRRG
jgi:uncharacterized protein involved in exopolysaccharide biosynthesis